MDLRLVFESALVGFGITSVFLLPYALRKSARYHQLAHQILQTSSRIAAVGSWGYLLATLLPQFIWMIQEAEKRAYPVGEMLSSYPWHLDLPAPLTLVFLTNLLWFKRLRQTPAVMTVSGLIVFTILQWEYIRVMLETSSGGYEKDSWALIQAQSLEPFGTQLVTRVGIFAVILLVVLFSSRWFGKARVQPKPLDQE